MLSCCLSVDCMRNPLIVSLSLYLSLLLSFLLFLAIFFPLIFLSLSLTVSILTYFCFSAPLPLPRSFLFSLSASVIGDFKLPLNFIINHTPLCSSALVASCQTHKDMQSHTQAQANIPPEPSVQGNY